MSKFLPIWPIVQCGFVCVDYGIYSADKGGWVAGNVAYLFTFSVLSVCVSIVQINPSDQAQIFVQ